MVLFNRCDRLINATNYDMGYLLAKIPTNMPMPDSPRLMMLMIGPMAGAVFGVILGISVLLLPGL